MTSYLIKKLAKNAINNGQVDKRVAKFALSNLSRKELIMFLSTLKRIIYETSVRVVSSEPLPLKTEQSIMEKFKDRNVFFEEDESQSAGMRVIMNDTVIDLTLGGYINNALQQLKK